MLLLIYDLCSAAPWLLRIKTYKSKRSQIYFTDKYLHAASYINSTVKNGLKSFAFPPSLINPQQWSLTAADSVAVSQYTIYFYHTVFPLLMVPPSRHTLFFKFDEGNEKSLKTQVTKLVLTLFIFIISRWLSDSSREQSKSYFLTHLNMDFFPTHASRSCE